MAARAASLRTAQRPADAGRNVGQGRVYLYRISIGDTSSFVTLAMALWYTFSSLDDLGESLHPPAQYCRAAQYQKNAFSGPFNPFILYLLLPMLVIEKIEY